VAWAEGLLNQAKADFAVETIVEDTAVPVRKIF